MRLGVRKKPASGPTATALLHFDGANGGTVFTDVHGHTFTAQGSGQTSTAQFKFGTASLSMLGTGAGYIQSAANSDWQFAGDFTLDFWYYTPDITHQRDCLGFGNFGIIIQNAIPAVYKGSAHSGGTLTANAWHHIAAVRFGTSINLYVDGISGVSYTDSATYGDNTTALTVGYYPVWGGGGQGAFMDELRIINGTAAWTTNFTPPTSSYSN